MVSQLERCQKAMTVEILMHSNDQQLTHPSHLKDIANDCFCIVSIFGLYGLACLKFWQLSDFFALHYRTERGNLS